MKFNRFFKKCQTFFLAWALLLTCAVPAIATPPIAFSEKVTTKNDTVLYEIEISADADVCGLSLEVKYAQDQVELSDCMLGEVLSGGIAKSNTNIQGKVVLTYISMEPLNSPGTVVLLEFKPISTSNQNIDVECTITECIDKACDEITYTLIEEKIANPNYVKNEPNQSTPDEDTTSSSDNTQASTQPATDTEDSEKPTAPSSGEQAGPSSTETVGTTTKPATETITQPTTEVTTENKPETPTTSADAGETAPTTVPETDETEGRTEMVEQTEPDLIQKETDPELSAEATGPELDQKKLSPSKTGIILGVCLGTVVLIIVVYVILSKTNLLKRRNKHEKN